jgi:hypothetical protein
VDPVTLRTPLLLALVVLPLATGCNQETEKEGKAAVLRYVDQLARAYRASDAEIVDPLLDDAQGIKVTGLIGVKQDMGLVLDATLLEIKFDRIVRDGPALIVETREKWRYLDRRIGSGAQVGKESFDAYAMRYRFEKKKDKLLLVDLTFIEPPQVGRADPAYRLDVQTAHGAPPSRDEEGLGAPPPADGPGQTHGRAP